MARIGVSRNVWNKTGRKNYGSGTFRARECLVHGSLGFGHSAVNDQIQREKDVHGERWNSVHNGYFVDPAVAEPLVRTIREVAGRARPDMIVDLGGGNGALLSQLRASGMTPGISLVDLDASATQLAAARAAGFDCLSGSVDSFSRGDLGIGSGSLLFVMRSVLHYFGQDGLRPVLRHLRAQAKPGELFVHQTASFVRQQDADCLNSLYRMMGSPKWYPTSDFLDDCLSRESWTVQAHVPALPLELKSDDLMQRYNLDEAAIRRIRERWSGDTSVPDTVFKVTEKGFSAFLHYWIYVCAPAT